MDIILFHSGSSLPKYLKYTFKQIRIFNPYENVHFITDSYNIYKYYLLYKMYNIKVYDKKNYHTFQIEEFIDLYNRKRNDFWTITATRLFYIANFMILENINNVFHFENDVLLYKNLRLLSFLFKKHKKIKITFGGPDKCMTGFMTIPNGGLLSIVCARMISLLSRGEISLKQEFGMDMVNEMTLLRAISKDKLTILDPLPTLPNELIGDSIDLLYDPAGWGQFLGGTQNQGPGAKPKDHYIGQLLRKNPKYKVIFKKDSFGRSIPYFFDGINKYIPIVNLHIHSKNLYKYMSL